MVKSGTTTVECKVNIMLIKWYSITYIEQQNIFIKFVLFYRDQETSLDIETLCNR